MNPKVLLIGCGYWGKNWYKTIQNSPYELAGVVDPDPCIPIACPVFKNLHDATIDYTHAIVAVNAKLHSPIASALNLPLHKVLIEKPCGTSLSDSLLIKKAFPGYIFLYSAAYAYIKENLSKIGWPRYWKSTRASMGPKVRSDVSILEDYMIHDIYLYLDLFGKCEIESSSYSQEFAPPTQRSSLHLELEGPPPGYFYSSWHYPDKERKVIISGSKGSFIWLDDDLYFDPTHYHDNEVVAGKRLKIDLPTTSNLERELDFFVKNKRPRICISEVWALINKIS